MPYLGLSPNSQPISATTPEQFANNSNLYFQKNGVGASGIGAAGTASVSLIKSINISGNKNYPVWMLESYPFKISGPPLSALQFALPGINLPFFQQNGTAVLNLFNRWIAPHNIGPARGNYDSISTIFPDGRIQLGYAYNQLSISMLPFLQGTGGINIYPFGDKADQVQEVLNRGPYNFNDPRLQKYFKSYGGGKFFTVVFPFDYQASTLINLEKNGIVGPSTVFTGLGHVRPATYFEEGMSPRGDSQDFRGRYYNPSSQNNTFGRADKSGSVIGHQVEVMVGNKYAVQQGRMVIGNDTGASITGFFFNITNVLSQEGVAKTTVPQSHRYSDVRFEDSKGLIISGARLDSLKSRGLVSGASVTAPDDIDLHKIGLPNYFEP